MQEKSENDKSVTFLCSTRIGRGLLHFILFIRFPKLMGFYLRSPLSHIMIPGFIRKHGIDMSEFSGQKYVSFNDFFTRQKTISFDQEKTHLISPCDSLLSLYDITEESRFHIKGFDYSLEDLFEAKEVDGININDMFAGGCCLVFRLCATDYHRYSYIDDGFIGENHYIEGSLYSVQPVACENFRVYAKNRRSWALLKTQNFGTVAQIEVGAFSVGGIINHHQNYEFKKGEEKGYFDLHGSTIVLLFQKDKINLLPQILNSAKNEEFRVKAGEFIGLSNL